MNKFFVIFLVAFSMTQTVIALPILVDCSGQSEKGYSYSLKSCNPTTGCKSWLAFKLTKTFKGKVLSVSEVEPTYPASSPNALLHSAAVTIQTSSPEQTAFLNSIDQGCMNHSADLEMILQGQAKIPVQCTVFLGVEDCPGN